TRHAERGWLPSLIVGTRLATVNEDFSLTSTRPGTSTDEFGGEQYTVINLRLDITPVRLPQPLFSEWLGKPAAASP
ncbi:MAG: hypothetical protein ACOVN9_12800, partial [Inhella sp.]